MLGAIRYGLANVLNFEGRDARQTFWYYVLFAYLLNLALSMVFVVPAMIGAFTASFQAAMQHPGDEAAAQAVASGAMSGIMEPMMWVGAISAVLMLVLLAASLVRRLHDSGLSGYWALVPGLFQVLGLIMMPAQMNRMMAALSSGGAGDPLGGVTAMQSQIGFTSLFGWVAIIAVIIFGVRKSNEGPNRYGETSVSF
jgi:uncharacterized membrane protein YhaH (DUF805 family)